MPWSHDHSRACELLEAIYLGLIVLRQLIPAGIAQEEFREQRERDRCEEQVFLVGPAPGLFGRHLSVCETPSQPVELGDPLVS